MESKLEVVNGDDIYKRSGLQANASKGLYVNSDTWIITPSPKGLAHLLVVASWNSLRKPMNAKILQSFIIGKEVGEAYEEGFQLAIHDNPVVVPWPWILTLEHDNCPPPDAITSLVRTASTCPDCGGPVDPWKTHCAEGHRGYDAVGGIYFTKDETFPTPMSFGNPANGDQDFAPRDVRQAMKDNAVLEVNGVAMGCTLFRKAGLKQMSRPWFRTDEYTTQDLWHCIKGRKELGARYAVDCGVKVGHFDYETGVMH